MNLRPHHILCAQNFIGYGYSEEFTEHMKCMTDELMQDGDVVLHEGCDDICGKCPHNIGGICSSHDKVDRMDRHILTVIGFDYGDTLNRRQVVSSVKEKIFETEEFSRICKTCQWYETCRKVQNSF